MRMLMYPGDNTWHEDRVEDSARAVVKLDLPEQAFMVGLLADIEKAKGSLSVKTNKFNSADIDLP